MPEPETCQQCSATIPASAPTGLCPKCLLARALTTTPDLNHETGPPTPENLGEWAHEITDCELLELIGAGGMGWVYKARHTKLNRFVAVKILPTTEEHDASIKERFMREARALAQLNHANIVEFIDSGVVDGHLYIVMEYVEGRSLREAIRAGRITSGEALSIVMQICEGLQCAHDQQVVHRDIKPGNILLDRSGKVKITDFGLVRFRDPNSDLFTLTLSTEFMGTPVYMAPEQRTSTHTVDQRADIYSLGAILYELLTGKLPAGKFAPPSQIADTDPRLDKVILQAMATKLERRYGDIGELKGALERILRHPRSSRSTRSPRAKRIVGLVAVLLSVTAIAVVSALVKSKLNKPPPLAVAPFSAAEAVAHQEAWAEYLGVPVEYTNSIGMVFRLIPPGEFTMGTPEAQIQEILMHTNNASIPSHRVRAIRNEGAPRSVRLTKPFYLGIHEVTVGQFRRFVRDTNYATDVERNGRGGGAFHDGKWAQRREHVWRTPGEWPLSEEQPVVHMATDDAEAFCNWLNVEEYAEYALPTDAEWEYAARSGTQGLYYPNDDPTALRPFAWTEETCPSGQKHPQPVGGKTGNAFGLHDMLGNAWEFCAGPYVPGPSSVELQVDPRGSGRGPWRLSRGGSCLGPAPLFVRCGARNAVYSRYISMDQGFRVAIVGNLHDAVSAWLPEVERHILLPLTGLEMMSETTREYSHTVTTPAFTNRKALLNFGVFHAHDNCGDQGMTWQVLDSAGLELRSGFSDNGSQWRWIQVPASPETEYTFVVKDEDTVFTGAAPGNCGRTGITLSLHADRVVDHVPELWPSERMVDTLAVAQGGASGDWVDVLPLVDVARDKIRGQWELADGGLRQVQLGNSLKELMLPVGVRDSYEIEVEFTKLAGHDSVNIRFPVREKNPLLVISGYPEDGYYSQVRQISDSARGGSQNPSRVKSPPLENERRYRCNLRVVVDGHDIQIASELDGQELVHWRGSSSLVSGSGLRGDCILFCRTLSVGNVDGAVEFHRIRVRSLEGVSDSNATTTVPPEDVEEEIRLFDLSGK